ncbi:hypothetical protein [Acidipila sp. EB88]|uniref:hypothetical protein n=1 Tax=Acidipila sp. EB88 TaxID=2305226 RepID=UPI0013159CB8|nr:hypothetical protein [Acidipila sp. EB88]
MHVVGCVVAFQDGFELFAGFFKVAVVDAGDGVVVLLGGGFELKLGFLALQLALAGFLVDADPLEDLRGQLASSDSKASSAFSKWPDCMD